MAFSVLLLGIALGFVFVAPPGPLAVTLVEVGMTKGRSAGARSGFGIAAGDLVVGSAAAIVVLFGGALPDGLYSLVRLASATILIALGLALILRPVAVESLAAAIQRPARTFFWLTVLTPTVFGAWIAIILALPFADDGAAIGTFVIGAGIASALYHVALGSAAGALGRHLRSSVMTRVARLGGVVFAAVGMTMLTS